jgi:cytochrome c peroxidase
VAAQVRPFALQNTPHSGPVGATVTINGTGFTGAMGAFKTPTLREVTKHAPYMHDGSIGTLLEVVMFCNQGGTRNPFLDPRIRPLNLSEIEINALLAFLQGLEGEGYQDVAPPAFPR